MKANVTSSTHGTARYTVTVDGGAKGQAQDTSRHTARAAASHLSPAEITKRDAASVDEDAAALARSLANKPLFPPHHHVYKAGKCTRCGRPEVTGG